MNPDDADLLLSYLDRTLSDESTAEIESRLLRESELAELLVELACDEVVIRGWAIGNSDHDVPLVANTGTGAHSRTRSGASKSDSETSLANRVRRRARSGRWIGGVAIATGLIVAAIVAIRQFGGNEAPQESIAGILTATSGDVTVAARGGDPAPVRRDHVIPPGASVRTGNNGTATVELVDGTTLDLAADTVLNFPFAAQRRSADETPTGNRFTNREDAECATGRVVVHAVTQPDTDPFLLDTPQSSIRVLGTRFTAIVSDVRTRVDVDEGQVRLTRISDRRSIELQPEEFAVVFPFPNDPLKPMPAGASEPLVLLPVAVAATTEKRPDENHVDQQNLVVSTEWSAFLRFDVPSDAVVENAELALHLLEASETTLEIFLVESDWMEAEVTSRHRPRVIRRRQQIVRFEPDDTGHSVAIDVTELVRQPGPVSFSLGIYLKPSIEFAGPKAAGLGPRLRINSPTEHAR